MWLERQMSSGMSLCSLLPPLCEVLVGEEMLLTFLALMLTRCLLRSRTPQVQCNIQIHFLSLPFHFLSLPFDLRSDRRSELCCSSDPVSRLEWPRQSGKMDAHGEQLRNNFCRSPLGPHLGPRQPKIRAKA